MSRRFSLIASLSEVKYLQFNFGRRGIFVIPIFSSIFATSNSKRKENCRG